MFLPVWIIVDGNAKLCSRVTPETEMRTIVLKHFSEIIIKKKRIKSIPYMNLCSFCYFFSESHKVPTLWHDVYVPLHPEDPHQIPPLWRAPVPLWLLREQVANHAQLISTPSISNSIKLEKEQDWSEKCTFALQLQESAWSAEAHGDPQRRSSLPLRRGGLRLLFSHGSHHETTL